MDLLEKVNKFEILTNKTGKKQLIHHRIFIVFRTMENYCNFLYLVIAQFCKQKEPVKKIP